jgi:short subunit dehydrogenase-like uncharacterized protein
MEQKFDVILYGASGFTGRQTVAYFHRNAPKSLRWAIAGRNREKLESIAQTYAPDVPRSILIADGDDVDALNSLCRQTRVILTTAGPFSKYGRNLVDACVLHGTHYVDITGETPFAADLIAAHHETAEANGTRIIPFSGFDSVPSDLGAFVCADYFRNRGTGTRRVFGSFKMRGGLNGGTVATALEMATSGRMKALRNVLLLNPKTRQDKAERRESADLTWPIHDPLKERWIAPFVMAPINTRVVRRSNALFAQKDQGYGTQFRYQEGYEAGGRFVATCVSLGLATFDFLLKSSAGRAIIRLLTPSPGRGPSEAKMDGGFFRCRLFAEGDDGSRIMVTLSSSGDPGNRVTVAALCESALALAADGVALPGGDEYGGILTPATGLGQVLVDRLTSIGWSFEIEEIDT